MHRRRRRLDSLRSILLNPSRGGKLLPASIRTFSWGNIWKGFQTVKDLLCYFSIIVFVLTVVLEPLDIPTNSFHLHFDLFDIIGEARRRFTN